MDEPMGQIQGRESDRLHSGHHQMPTEPGEENPQQI